MLPTYGVALLPALALFSQGHSLRRRAQDRTLLPLLTQGLLCLSVYLLRLLRH